MDHSSSVSRRNRDDELLARRSPVAVGLGYMMVVGGSLYKIPQILQIHRAASAKGISLLSCIFSMIGQAFSLAYSVAHGHPLSTYGEAFPSFACTLVIALQSLRYERAFSGAKLSQVIFFAVVSAYAACRCRLLLGARNRGVVLSAMQASVPIVTVFEKLPQVLQTFRERSTGELSVSTAVLSWIGTATRVYTSFSELSHDRKAAAPHAVGFCLNSATVAQFLLFRKRPLEKDLIR
eukprot:TRINITY_DN73616_c0_g1_i1.p1 TRINITY_DN73616_c0_g1~~TRINITY_DN73616_c0_g1_i1.p1  ORF type:complete len:236 (-),score=21.10 TRINITY_DN73616_c0_g1_i1:56-763(-)